MKNKQKYSFHKKKKQSFNKQAVQLEELVPIRGSFFKTVLKFLSVSDCVTTM